MPLENLEEEGLPKNPDLRIAQLRFLLSLRPRAPDPAARDELMAAVRLHSECGRSGDLSVRVSVCQQAGSVRGLKAGGSRLWLPQVSPEAVWSSCVCVRTCVRVYVSVPGCRRSLLEAVGRPRGQRGLGGGDGQGFGHSAVLPRSWLPARLEWLLVV